MLIFTQLRIRAPLGKKRPICERASTRRAMHKLKLAIALPESSRGCAGFDAPLPPRSSVLIVTLSGSKGLVGCQALVAPGHHFSVLTAGEISAVVHVGPPPAHLRPSILGKGQLAPEQVRAGDEQSSPSLAEGCHPSPPSGGELTLTSIRGRMTEGKALLNPRGTTALPAGCTALPRDNIQPEQRFQPSKQQESEQIPSRSHGRMTLV